MSHPNSKSKTSLATLFPFSMRDLIVTALILFVAVTFCILLQRLDPSAGFATPLPPREMGSGTWVWGFRCAAP